MPREMEVCNIQPYEDNIMKSPKYCLKQGEKRRNKDYNGGSEPVHGTLFTCMESSQ
jgi:hypothetical protein